ncbi:membrane protein [Sorangium cellulosum]|uniref:Membrane protein n=1 Tax=Sorangium cellulosum TaxID=56 RepID=A0A4V0NDY1_SORCE|nr:DMT family transporter [Sorangium cellulosum]AUX24252.1 membrane protein [Sorangium cellulosum]
MSSLPLTVRSRLLILTAALLWSTGGAGIKLISLNAWQVTCGRSLIAALVLGLALPGARRLPTWRTLGAAAASAATMVLFVQSTKLTTAANAIFLQSTAPLYVLLLSPWLLRERPSRGEKLAVPVFVAGMGLFFLDQLSAGQLLGNALALVSGVMFALALVGLRAAQDENPVVLLWGNLLAGLGTLPLALGGAARPGALDVGLLVFLGAVQLGLPYAIFGRGVRHTPALEASLLVLVEPVLNPVWALLLVGERPGVWSMVGGAVILGATAWRTVQASRPAAAEA